MDSSKKLAKKARKLTQKATHSFFLTYTFLFCVAAFIVFFSFFTTGHSFIWKPDGTSQHFTAFVYLGKYLREVIKSIFAGSLVIPQFDLSLGFGEDIFTVLQYYVIGDPLDLLSAIVPSKYAVYAFDLLILFRFYLAGLAFGALAKYKKLPTLNCNAGALIYAFCAYGLFYGVRHPFFINPMIYFPLVILGIEMIFDKKRPYLFIGAICLSAISNFYFFYIISLFTVLYIFVRIFFVYKDHYIKNLWNSFLKFGGSYLLGILLSAIIFLPVIITFLSSNRSGVEYKFNMFYDQTYYRNFFASLTNNLDMGKMTYLGLTAMGIVGLVFLFFKKKKYSFLKISLLISTIFLMFPVFGKIINGFSYVTNRWVWVYALLVAFSLAITIEDMKKVTFKQSFVLLGVAFLFAIYTLMFTDIRVERNLISSVLLLCFAGLTVIYAAYPFAVKNTNKQALKKIYSYSILAFVFVGVIINGFYFYNKKETSYVDQFMTILQAEQFAHNNGFKKINNLQNNENAVERCNIYALERADYNDAAINETYGTTEYFSMANNYVNQLRQELGEVHSNFSFIDGNDGDPFLNIVENVKFFGAHNKKDLPYGFDKNELETVKSNAGDIKKSKPFGIYENKNYVPFGYTCKNIVSQKDYDSLDLVDKRSVFSKALVINDNNEFANVDINDFKENNKVQKIDFNNTKNIVNKDNFIYVDKERSEVKVDTSTLHNSQVYIVFKGIEYYPCTKEELMKNINEEEYNNLTDEKLEEIRKADKVKIPEVRSSVKVIYKKPNNKKTEKNLSFGLNTAYNDYYTGLRDFTLNLGYVKDSIDEIKIQFQAKGKYSIDSIEIISVPMDTYEEDTKELASNTLQNLNIGTNEITGDITTNDNEWLYLSIPYSPNWSAYVDGEKVELHRANTAFSAINLTEGHHDIKLTYSNKMIKLGAMVSGVGIVILIGVIAIWETKNKKRKKENLISK